MIQQRFDTELAPAVVTFTGARLSDGVLGCPRGVPGRRARQTIDETYGSLLPARRRYQPGQSTGCGVLSRGERYANPPA